MTKAERREHEAAAIEHLREAGYDVRLGCHPEHPLVEVVTIDAVPFAALQRGDDGINPSCPALRFWIYKPRNESRPLMTEAHEPSVERT